MQNVVCLDTQRSIDRWLNAAAEQHGFDAEGFLGGAIAESNLREHAARERVWPDVSYGLFQPAVKWLGPEVAGLTRSGVPPTVADTPQNRWVARDYFWDAARSIQYVAPRYAALLTRWGDPLEAWCRWNKPNIPGIENPHRANYERGLEEAARYRMADYNIGPGVLAAIEAAGDQPRSDENYRLSGISETFARDAIYYYIASDNRTVRIPFEPTA